MKAQFPDEQSEAGEFERQEDTFRRWIYPDASSALPAARGRYHLYISLACPWASRAFIVLKLKRLEDAVGVTVADPIRDERGWAFRDGPGYCKDPVNGFNLLSEAYEATTPGYAGRVTVPVLWDKQTRAIVNNSEDDICRMFNDAFNAFGDKTVNLFPADIAPSKSNSAPSFTTTSIMECTRRDSRPPKELMRKRHRRFSRRSISSNNACQRVATFLARGLWKPIGACSAH